MPSRHATASAALFLTVIGIGTAAASRQIKLSHKGTL
jgi:hypothetical protein